MTKLITASNLSVGWLVALEHLLVCGGKDTNMIVEIEHVDEENLQMRQLLDDFFHMRSIHTGEVFLPVTTVANTLFPQSLYQPHRGKDARPFLYQMYEQNFTIIQRLPANNHGTYFQRMIAWPAKDKKRKKVENVNQLENIICRLRKGLSRQNALSSAYEIGISDVATETEEIRIYQPDNDGRLMGFPCLSHISLTFFKKQLHLTAVYRNQYFLHKAYGNYVGLSRLQRFLCQEIGCEPGTLMCIASHADAELNIGKRAIIQLIQQCKLITAEKVSNL